MNSQKNESKKKIIPLLIRSDQWVIKEHISNQVSAICQKKQFEDNLLQQRHLIYELNQKIHSQDLLIADLLKNAKNQKELSNRFQLLLTISKLKSPDFHTCFLMADSESEQDATVFGSQIKRSEISAVYTKNTLENVPSSAWDVSAFKDGSVMAWICKDSCEETGSLYLAANGMIYANPDSSYQFANYTRLVTADFSCLKTDLVTHMNNMFDSCEQLHSLDISKWNVSNVTDMSAIFWNCKQLEILDISQWNVSNVTDMHDFFWGCNRVQPVNISQWNVSNVTDMNFMFAYCSNYINSLKKGAFSSWNLNDQISMENICIGTNYEDTPMDLFNRKKFFLL